jgi:hypothetical protein
MILNLRKYTNIKNMTDCPVKRRGIEFRILQPKYNIDLLTQIIINL